LKDTAWKSRRFAKVNVSLGIGPGIRVEDKVQIWAKSVLRSLITYICLQTN
jgi:hypothetical protein